jgi:hypothetical protein
MRLFCWSAHHAECEHTRTRPAQKDHHTASRQPHKDEARKTRLHEHDAQLHGGGAPGPQRRGTGAPAPATSAADRAARDGSVAHQTSTRISYVCKTLMQGPRAGSPALAAGFAKLSGAVEVLLDRGETVWIGRTRNRGNLSPLFTSPDTRGTSWWSVLQLAMDGSCRLLQGSEEEAGPASGLRQVSSLERGGCNVRPTGLHLPASFRSTALEYWLHYRFAYEAMRARYAMLLPPPACKSLCRRMDGSWLRAVRALYADVPMSVRTAQGLSPCFQASIGLKQGCPLNPTLFGLYIDDFEAAAQRESSWICPASLAAAGQCRRCCMQTT